MTTTEHHPTTVDLGDITLAAEQVVVAGYASQKLVQRKLRVSWDTAGEILEALEWCRVVGAPDDEGTYPVLAVEDELTDLLARLQEPLAEPDDDMVESASQEVVEPVRVSLEKPTHQPAVVDVLEAEEDPPGDELELRQAAEVERYDATPTPRQQMARMWARVADEPAVLRTRAVTRQAPKAGARLVIWTPRGAVRVVAMYVAYLRDAETLRLLAHHEQQGLGLEYAKVARARQDKNVAGRQWLHGLIAAVLALVGLAWWAPQVFAGILAATAFLIVLLVGRSVCRDPKELAGMSVAALALGGLAWWQGPNLAALIPQPPGWVWIALAVVAVVVFGVLGRKEDQHLVEMPARMATHEPPPVTAPMIVEALFRIGVAGMTMTAADKGMRDEIRVRAPGVGRALHGWQIELELPPGITAGDVGEQREELAGALRRPLGCVWPSGGGDHPGHLRIYLGDKPMATALQSDWPLATGEAIDIFDPFYLFTDEEGRWVAITLLGTHVVVAGASGFGKSVTLRQLAVACALDPRVRLYTFDGKISGDLAPLQKVAHCYYEGGEPEDIAKQLAALQGIEKEMRRRARFLRDLPPDERSPKVTSALASRYAHLSPIVLLIDEVQEYTEYGIKGNKDDKEIRDAFIATLTRISRLGRSAGIAMVLVSQKPEASVIPTAIMGNCSIRVCHKVTEQSHNDQVLGTSAYKNGYNAALFSQEDRGLAWLRAEGDPRVVRSWSAMVELDPAIELVDKAYALRKHRNLLTGQAADDGVVDAEVVYDIVQDAEQVMSTRGCGKAQWGELVGWLREMREQYAALTEEELSASVRAAKVRVADVRSGGSVRKGVYISDLRKRGGADVAD